MTSVTVRLPGPGSADRSAVRDGEGAAVADFRALGEAEGDGGSVRGEGDAVEVGLGAGEGPACAVRCCVDDDGPATTSPVC
ncbi:hypothetical protein ABZX40_07385 [Streptomyces sp. NPDC004610]|uniref:hypothetical protein n=1 Tax=unclassified Streptomyces TaxID=2593676 RepID=UPI0033A50E88